MNICTSKIIHINLHHHLTIEIEEYLSLHLELFSNCLKPKHHFLIHYGQTMEAIGPLWNISSMIFEHKHQERKMLHVQL